MDFRLQLLGAPALSRGSEPLKVKERKGLALLAVLGWTHEAVDRSILADLLWSERGDEQARTSLRVLLTKLNRVAPGLLKLDRQTVALSECCRLLHREELESWRRSGMVPAPSGLLDEPLKGFAVRGAPAFERWLEEARLGWRHELRGALERVGREAPDSGARTTALRQALTLDPWHEELHQALVLELLGLRQGIEALRHLDAHSRDLMDEMGLPLTVELAALRQRALAQSWEGRVAESDGGSTPRFGGEQEWVELRSLLGDPGASLISVVGPPGSGTSRLVADALVGFPDRRLTIDAVGMSAAAVWRQLQRTARSQQAPETVFIDNLHGVQELAGLVDRWFAAEPEQARPPRLVLALHAAIGHVRERVVRVRPLALPPEPAAAGFDPEEAAQSPAVRLLLHHAGALPGAQPTMSLIQASEVAHWAHGHPLTLILFARASMVALDAARNGLPPTGLVADPPAGLPQRHRSLEQALAIGLQGLPEGQVEVLRALACCRAPCRLEVLEAVVELESALLTRLLQRLMNRDLIQSSVSLDGALRFALAPWLRWLFRAPARNLQLRHSRVYLERARLAAADAATPQRARLLQSLGPEMVDVEAALDALATEDPLRALLFASDIAPLHRRFGRAEEALGRLRQLLASVRHRLSDEQLGDALNALGGLALFARATSEARGAYNDALAIRARLGDAEKLAFTRMNLAILDALLGDAEAALSGLLSALEATAPAPRSWTRAAILTNLGNAYYTHGDSGSALAPLESAARLFWELGDAEGSAGAAAGLVANAASVGDPAKIAVAYKLLYRALEALSESADGHLLGAMRHAADRLRDGGFVDYAQDVRRLRLRLKKLTAATQSVGTL